MADAPSSDGGGAGAFWLIFIILILFVMWIQGGGPSRGKHESLFTLSTSSENSSLSQSSSGGSAGNDEGSVANPSPYKGQISIETGTAASTDQPNQEYIVLRAGGSNSTSINIGGWTLSNGRSEKTFDINGNAVSGQSVYVLIPKKGIALYNPYQPASNILVPITLKPGESAVITTGQLPSTGSVTIRDNFKVNRCLGYVADNTTYQFVPDLNYRCPDVSEMVGLSDLSDICFDFAQSISACHEPKYSYVEDQGDCLEGNCSLNSYCQGVIKNNLNPQACFKEFSKDKDFVGPEWRVFLKRSLELWSERRETISLYDAAGRLVDQATY